MRISATGLLFLGFAAIILNTGHKQATQRVSSSNSRVPQEAEANRSGAHADTPHAARKERQLSAQAQGQQPRQCETKQGGQVGAPWKASNWMALVLPRSRFIVSFRLFGSLMYLGTNDIEPGENSEREPSAQREG